MVTVKRLSHNEAKISRNAINSNPNNNTNDNEHEILKLQRLIGNHAVMRMLDKGELNTNSPSPNNDAVVIQRKVMTSAEFLAMGGDAKKDIALGPLTLKKQSAKYKEIAKKIDDYHTNLKQPVPDNINVFRRFVNDSGEFAFQLCKALGAYAKAHNPQSDPTSPRNKAIITAYEQALNDRRIWFIASDMVSGTEGITRFETFMSGNGKGLTTLNALLERAPSDPNDAIGFFGADTSWLPF